MSKWSVVVDKTDWTRRYSQDVLMALPMADEDDDGHHFFQTSKVEGIEVCTHNAGDYWCVDIESDRLLGEAERYTGLILLMALVDAKRMAACASFWLGEDGGCIVGFRNRLEAQTICAALVELWAGDAEAATSLTRALQVRRIDQIGIAIPEE